MTRTAFTTTGLLVLLILSAFYLNPTPRLFVIGDSISMQYGPHLERLLQGVLEYQRKQDDAGANPELGVPAGPNGGDSRMVLEYLRLKTKDPEFDPDYLLLNCGLHDIKRYPDSAENQVPPDSYRDNLQSILDLMRQKDIQVIWVRTTPVVDSIHNTKQKSFKRYSADLATYNQIADEVMAASNIPSIDLHAFTEKLGADQFIDHVHYSEPSRKLQAAFIAGYFSRVLDG